MISLVACGHALGGVRQVDFPTTVPQEVEFANFSNKVGFKDLIVQQYLDGSTEDPLVIGKNTTTNSDLRIFSSDRNATMRSMASNDNFNKICQSLLERMINTVPKNVKLTDVVDPIEHKVLNVQLFPSNGSFVLNTNLRFLHENPKRVVTMFWKERSGSSCQGCFVNSTSSNTDPGTALASIRGVTFTTYSFTAVINGTTSISQFWFKADEKDGKPPVRIDNGGHGYLLDDTVLFDAGKSQFIFDPNGGVLILVVAVKNASPSTKVSFRTFQRGGETTVPPFIPKFQNVDLDRDDSIPPSDGYTYYSTKVDQSTASVDVKASVGGKT